MFEVWKDKAGEWRWTLVAANRKIIADSAEGYRRRNECQKAIVRAKALVATAGVVELLEVGAGKEDASDAE